MDPSPCHPSTPADPAPDPSPAQRPAPGPDVDRRPDAVRPGGPRRPGRIAAALRAAADLGLPATCAGCGRWEVALCPDCLALISAPPRPVPADAAGALEVHALAAYTGPVRCLVLGWKNGAREDLDPVMGAAGVRAGAAWAASLPESARGRADAAGRLLVVPAPSGPMRRLRGRLVAAVWADAVAMGLARGWTSASPESPSSANSPSSPSPANSPSSPSPAKSPSSPHGPAPLTVLSADVLRRARRAGPARQAGGSARQRRRNRSLPPRVLADVSGIPLVLVDDVLTTGATLGACARALTGAGASVLGALVVAAAPSPRRRTVTLLPESAAPPCAGPPGAPYRGPSGEEPHHGVTYVA